MTTANVALRAASDIRSVCRYATTESAVRWLIGFSAHAVKCAKTGSLTPADQAWARAGARFQPPGGPVIRLPGMYTAGAREMYCRNVYLRTGLVMPRAGWVVDLGANRGLFSVWAAAAGAQVVAVEAQQGFAPVIRDLAAHNGVADQVHVEIAMAVGEMTSETLAGVLGDDQRWANTSHGAEQRPPCVSVPGIMSNYRIARIGLLKVDIEGGEFSVFAAGEDLRWLERVDQVVMEVHPDWGDTTALIKLLREHDYSVDLRDNDGIPVSAQTGRVDYAYCRRSSPVTA